METIILTGNLTEDAKAMNKDGKDFTIFTLAVDDQRSKEVSRFYSCIMYGESKNRIKHLVKGAKVTVIGDFTPSIYQETGKTPLLNLNVKVNTLDFVYIPKAREEATGQ